MLIGDQPKADLSQRAGRYHAFRALSRVAAQDSVDGDIRPDGGALVEAIAGFSPPPLDFGSSQNRTVRGAGSSHIATFFFAPHVYFVIKAGDGYAAMFIMQSGDNLAERHRGIVNGPAEGARVQLLRWPEDLDLGAQPAALGIADGRLIGGDHASVRDDRGYGPQGAPVTFDKWGQVGAADLFFPFEDADHVHRQSTVGL